MGDPQRALRERCVHPSGAFVEFPRSALDESLAARFARQVARFPDRLAVRSGDHEVTYAELDRVAGRVARCVGARLGPGNQAVAVFLEQSTTAIAAVLGLLKAGKICVVLDPDDPAPRTAQILEDAGARLVITDAPRAAAARDRGGAPLVLEEIGESGPLPDPMRWSADRPTFLSYTSGTTGAPKAVVHTSRTLLHLLRNYTNAVHICPADRLTGLRPLSFLGGVRDSLAALLNGAALLPLDVRREGMAALAEWLREHAITIAYFGAPLFRAFASSLDGRQDLPSLRVIRIGGDTVFHSDVDAFRRCFAPPCVLVTGFSTSEAIGVSQFFVDHDTVITTATVPVGYPFEDVSVLLMDADARPVAEGEVGEITVGAASQAHGYWRRPGLTADAFRPGPAGSGERVYRTGDLGRRQDDGCLEHVGRADLRTKIRGHRVEILEIEAALGRLPGVREAVVVAVGDASGERRLVAYVVPGREPAPTASVLSRGLARVLPAPMVPAHFVLLGSLPLAPHGKIDRTALPAPDGVRPALDSPYVPPRTPIEETLAAIWATVLGLDRVGVDDRFLELGGQSLQAMRIAGRVLADLDVDLSPRVLLESATVREMAVAVLAARLREAGERGDTDERA